MSMSSKIQFLKEKLERITGKAVILEDRRGISGDKFIPKFEALTELFGNSGVEYRVPSDIYGHAAQTVKDPTRAVHMLQDLQDYYAKKEESVNFYIWAVFVKRKAEQYEKILKAAEVEYQNYDIDKLTELVRDPEVKDSISTVSVSLSSSSKDSFGQAMSSGKHGPLD